MLLGVVSSLVVWERASGDFLTVSQEEWDRIFGKKDNDKAECVQLHLSFEEPILYTGYYDKKILENLKTNILYTAYPH
jgi:hypothetical protein